MSREHLLHSTDVLQVLGVKVQGMRVVVLGLLAFFVATSLSFGVELTEEQLEPWNTLEEQVALDMKKDIEGEMAYLHPKGVFWGEDLPSPVSPSAKLFSYYAKWMQAQDEVVATAFP